MPDVDPNKTVFITYRRSASRYIARSIFEHLHHHKYDVFLDVETIDSGDWATIILNQIAARTHFLIILTPETLDRCSEPNDMLRREIERAMELKRNIVPVLVDEFNFGMVETHLIGKLAELPQYNGLRLHYDYFDDGMKRLRSRYLKQPIYSPILHPTPMKDEPKVEKIIHEMAEEPIPTSDELMAEQLYGRGIMNEIQNNINAALSDYNEAIQLDPNHEGACYRRGVLRSNLKDWDGAISDFNESIRLNPQHMTVPFMYNDRGDVRLEKGDWEGAISDYSEAIELHPQFTTAYANRGTILQTTGNLYDAIEDYNKALKIQPDFARVLNNRGEIYFELKQYEKALNDFQLASDVDPLEADLPEYIYKHFDAGLAITHHALGNIHEARRIWKGLIEQDVRYKDAEWVGKEFNWAEPLVEVARKLISELD